MPFFFSLFSIYLCLSVRVFSLETADKIAARQRRRINRVRGKCKTREGHTFLLVLLANKARRVEQIILAARFIFNVHGTRTIPSAEENVTRCWGFSHSVVFPVLAGLVTRRAASCPIKMHRTTQPSSAPVLPIDWL